MGLMLWLKAGESIEIGEAEILIAETRGKRVRIRIDVPEGTEIGNIRRVSSTGGYINENEELIFPGDDHE